MSISLPTPNSQTPTPIIAIDPGSDKCGLALVINPSGVLQKRIVASAEIESALREWMKSHAVARLVLGNATTSRAMKTKLETIFPEMEITVVEEKNSTLEARALFWEANPPRGWRRFIPLSLQVPPVPVDDFAAVVLARRFFGQIAG